MELLQELRLYTIYTECCSLFTQELDIADIDWESSGLLPDESFGVNVPTVECPLTPEQLAALKDTVDPRSQSQSHGTDIYMAAVQFCQSLE